MSLIKQVFFVLLSFCESLACHRTKCLFLIDKPCMVRATLINLKPVEHKYYLILISLDKCSGSCNVLSPEICVPKETKDKSIKVFNMITNKNEAKTMAKHISCDCKWKFNSATCNSNEEWNNKTCECKYKNYRKCKENYSWNPNTCICKNRKYLKNIADTSVIECAEIIPVTDIVSTKKASTIATNVTKNCHSNKGRN